MQSAMLALLAALALCGGEPAAAAKAISGHPIVSAIDKLNELISTVEDEHKTEAVSYEKLDHWCTRTLTMTRNELTNLGQEAEQLNATITANQLEVDAKTAEIKGLDDEIAAYGEAGKAAADQHGGAMSVFGDGIQDLDATVSAIKECLEILNQAKADTSPTKLLLAQQHVREALPRLAVDANLMTDAERKELENFVAKGTDVSGAVPSPAPVLGDWANHVENYDFKSDSVIELLKGLQMKFEDELLQKRTQKTNTINAYGLANGARSNLITAAELDKDKKTTILETARSAVKQATEELAVTRADLKTKAKILEDTTKECDTKKAEWDQRSSLRADELKTMKTAVYMLSKVTGVRTEMPTKKEYVNGEQPTFFMQLKKKALQVIMGDARRLKAAVHPDSELENPGMRAVQLLRNEARVIHSSSLERLAQEISAHLSGPLDKFPELETMIQKMVFHLIDEQQKEDSHKHWCDQEVNKSDATIASKSGKIESLESDKVVLQGQLTQLAVDIGDAENSVKELAARIEEYKTIRDDNEKENALAIKDAQAAQTALTKAYTELHMFYKDSGKLPSDKELWKAPMLVETKEGRKQIPDDMKPWDESKTIYEGLEGVDDPETGVLALLQKIVADFSQMEAETKAQEEADKLAFLEQMKISETAKARDEEDITQKRATQTRLTQELSTVESQLKLLDGEKSTVEQYKSDLHHACVQGDSTYEERKGARASEIDALTRAKQFLVDMRTKGTFLQRRPVLRQQ